MYITAADLSHASVSEFSPRYFLLTESYLWKASRMATPNAADEKPDVVMIENSIRDDLEENLEKAPRVFHVDGFNVLGLSPEDAEFYQNYSIKERKKTTHKVDIRLVPMLAVSSRKNVIRRMIADLSRRYTSLHTWIDPTSATPRLKELMSTSASAVSNGTSSCPCSSCHTFFSRSLATSFSSVSIAHLSTWESWSQHGGQS